MPDDKKKDAKQRKREAIRFNFFEIFFLTLQMQACEEPKEAKDQRSKRVKTSSVPVYQYLVPVVVTDEALQQESTHRTRAGVRVVQVDNIYLYMSVCRSCCRRACRRGLSTSSRVDV